MTAIEKLKLLLANSYARRLGVAVLTLAILDPFVPRILERAERAQYESQRRFRFENSDLFALGPVTAYLREHPRGDRPRTVFFGDSIVWGYNVAGADSVPAQFQRIATDQSVFNFGLNGSQAGDAYLMAKAIIDSVDTIYLFANSRRAIRVAPSLIPIDDADVREFELKPVNPLERWLQQPLNRWRLYRDSYRLQAGFFGTSTRLYVYLNKASLVRDGLRILRGQSVARPSPPVDDGPVAPGVTIAKPVAAAPPDASKRQMLQALDYTPLWKLASLVRAHGKRAVVIESAWQTLEIDPGLADLNAEFNPDVVFIRLEVPTSLRIDGQHISAKGARAVAEALHAVRLPELTGR